MNKLGAQDDLVDIHKVIIMNKTITRRDSIKTIGLAAGSVALAGSGCSSGKDAHHKRPNILFFFPDQHRFDWTELNGALPLRTPNLKALTNRGVRFTNAVCPSPLCAPVRASIASGKEYGRCGVAGNLVDYPVEQTTFYTLLRDSGYHVTGCGKFDLRKPSYSWGRDGKQIVNGIDYMSRWGFSAGIDNSGKWDGYRSYRNKHTCPYYVYLEEKGLAEVHIDDFTQRKGRNFENTDPTPLPDEAYVDNWIARNGLDLIRSAPPGKPWFLQVNFNGPHDPMDITKSMKSRWQGIRFPQPDGCESFTPEKHIEIRQNYSAMVENIDRWLGVYMEELESCGELDNTLIVFSSDHGEMLGDHDRWAKTVPYQPSVSVPMVIGGPGVRWNAACAAPATTLDLTATFLDYADAAVPADMDSRSMKPFLAGNSAWRRDYVLSGLGQWRMVFDGRYKLVRGFDVDEKRVDAKKPAQHDPVLLFDLKDDPLENVDLAAKAPDRVEQLTEALQGE